LQGGCVSPFILRQEGANRKMASLRYHKFWIGFWDYRYIAEIKRLVQVVISYYVITGNSGP
jgi:hypothetical protein